MVQEITMEKYSISFEIWNWLNFISELYLKANLSSQLKKSPLFYSKKVIFFLMQIRLNIS